MTTFLKTISDYLGEIATTAEEIATTAKNTVLVVAEIVADTTIDTIEKYQDDSPPVLRYYSPESKPITVKKIKNIGETDLNIGETNL
tara:strand:- start:987 stop:1247 length:261 start_codon:yes stop_codon:yes gene_type:complete